MEGPIFQKYALEDLLNSETKWSKQEWAVLISGSLLTLA